MVQDSYIALFWEYGEHKVLFVSQAVKLIEPNGYAGTNQEISSGRVIRPWASLRSPKRERLRSGTEVKVARPSVPTDDELLHIKGEEKACLTD